MTAAELSITVRNLKDLMNMRGELEAEITAAKDTIKSEMRPDGFLGVRISPNTET